MSIAFASTNDGMVAIRVMDELPIFVPIVQFDEHEAGKVFANVIERVLGSPNSSA